MSTSPAATPVTVPELLTVAIAVFDDCHAARLVTDCVVPSDSRATAVNCAAWPIDGVDPETVIDATELAGPGAGVGAAVGWELPGLPHASAFKAKAASTIITPANRERATRWLEFVILFSSSSDGQIP
jgi:hypothetical protein